MRLRIAVQFIFYISILSSYSAFGQQKATQTVSGKRFTVNFVSIGAGIDHKDEQRFLDYLNLFQKENKVTLHYKTEHWGKEAETKYSIDLKNLSRNQQKNLKSSLKEMFGGNKLVQVGEVSP